MSLSSQRETVFMLSCVRLRPMFWSLQRLFNKDFTMEIFCFGFKYVQCRQNKCKLLNFILGQAKMAIYLSRKNKIDHPLGNDTLALFSA